MITAPSLEILNEEQLMAEGVALIAGGETVENIDRRIAAERELRIRVEAGLDTPICPELTNANPSSAPIALIYTFCWLLAQLANKINQIPVNVLVAFANLFGMEQRPATAAVTVLRFTAAGTSGGAVTIPIGTEVSSEDGAYVFRTTELGTRTGDGAVDVPAERTVAGHTLLSPDVLTLEVDNVNFIDSVTNPNAIDSGLELESLASTLERVARYQRRGERIVSTKDLEDAILDEGLLGNGIVRAFPYVENGDFVNAVRKPGYTSVVVMTRTGDVIDDTTRTRCVALVDQAVGNQFVYIVDPSFVDFNVTASVRLNIGAPETAVRAAIETNLRNFYAAAASRFGKGIYLGDVVALIEGTPGVDHIPNGLLTSPPADQSVQEYELPRLVTVTLSVV